MTVVVLGATGKTGRPLCAALRARGADVRAAHRPGFDWADRGTWNATLTGAEALYIVGPFGEPDGAALVSDLLAAASDTRRVVLLSVLGADLLGPATAMAAWEDAVRTSGKEWTILRPNWFQQNFGEGFAPALRDAGMLRLPAADAALAFVDVVDIADVAAAALTEDGHAGQIYLLTGPAAFTHQQALDIIGRAADRELRYVSMPVAEFEAQLQAAGLEERLVTWQLALFDLIRSGHNAIVTDTVERVTGRPARPLSAYAHDHAEAWRVPSPAVHP